MNFPLSIRHINEYLIQLGNFIDEPNKASKNA